MKNKKLIFGVLFAGVLALNTLVLSTTNNNDLQLNSLFTLASAQAGEDGEDGEGNGYQWEQDWYKSSGNCFDYTCILGMEIEKICQCSTEQGMCFSSSINDCYDTEVHVYGDFYDCVSNGYTQMSCSD